MVPYGSVLGIPGDWACCFQEDGIRITPARAGDRQFYPISDWAWQPFPYTDSEWVDLYRFSLDRHSEPISQQYGEMLYLPLAQNGTEELFLLRMDRQLWLVRVRHDSRLGSHFTRIDSLAP